MTIAEALTLRAGFANIKRQLAESGLDVSEVKTISDLPSVLASIVPESLVEQVEAISTNEIVLTTLVRLMESDAVSGIMAKLMTLPPDQVSEDDLNA